MYQAKVLYDYFSRSCFKLLNHISKTITPNNSRTVELIQLGNSNLSHTYTHTHTHTHTHSPSLTHTGTPEYVISLDDIH